MLNIAIANDTEIAIEALRRAIAATPNSHLLWVARTGIEAVEQCAVQRPDIILMDMNMPALDGVNATRQIMQQSPCAILIVTASITGNTSKVFEAMGYGALDVVKTPRLSPSQPEATQDLLRKIIIVARLAQRCPQPTRLSTLQAGRYTLIPNSSPLPPLVVIGASTGGPNALQQILSQLPPNLNAAVVIIQHINEQFAPGLVEWLNRFSPLPVSIAKRGDRLEVGKVLVAGSNDHLILRPNRTLRYTSQPADDPHRPSVNAFFSSVAQHWPQPGIALLLTGMGRDGADGMALLHSAGWHTVAESESSCVVFGMPKAAIARGAVSTVLPLDQIAPYISQTIGTITIDPLP